MTEEQTEAVNAGKLIENALCVFFLERKKLFVLGHLSGGQVKVYGKKKLIPLAHATTFQYVTGKGGGLINIK